MGVRFSRPTLTINCLTIRKQRKKDKKEDMRRIPSKVDRSEEDICRISSDMYPIKEEKEDESQ